MYNNVENMIASIHDLISVSEINSRLIVKHNMFGWLERILVFTFVIIKRFLAGFILFRVLGWKTDKGYNSYFPYRRGRHIVTYAHTSVFDQIIGFLLFASYDIPVVSVGTQDIENLPIIGYLLKQSGMIFIDRMQNTNTVRYISGELKKRQNFVFSVAPEGTMQRVTDIKDKFYLLARDTNANIHIMRLDYTTQTVSIERVAPDAIVQTHTYDTIKSKLLDEMRKERPYVPSAYHFASTDSVSRDSQNSTTADAQNTDVQQVPKITTIYVKKTSLINVNRSCLTYLPPVLVMYILFRVLF